MPKTTKRDATRRAEKIAKAHATPPPPIQVRQPKQPRSVPGYKRPARGLARYPWAIVLTLLVIGVTIFTLYFYHLGPFAPPKPVVVKPTPTPNLTLPNPSPCAASSIVSELTDKSAAPTAAEIAKIQHTYSKAPAMTIDVHKFYCVGINTNRGLIVLELDPQYAPVTVNNFVYLAENHFYDGLVFHRVVPGFVIQGGDPKGTGQGGPGYAFKDEPVRGNYTEGCVAMANTGQANTNGSQFFICTANDTTKLQKSYNLFGRVVLGMDVALKIQGPGDASSTKNIKPDVMNYVTVVPVA